MKERTDLTIYNIKEIVTPTPPYPKKGELIKEISVINNGGLAIKKGRFIDISTSEKIRDLYKGDREIDLKNKSIVLPAFVESHTHLIFGGSREEEFLLRLEGKDYLNILKEGGGIKKTKKDTLSLNEKTLIKNTIEKLNLGISYGIATFNIKTGYGIDLEKELYILNVINKIKEKYFKNIVPSLLLHLMPDSKSKEEFLKELTNCLNFIIEKKLSNHFDIFIEKGAFDFEISDEILEIVKKLGFNISLHIDQFNNIDGAKLGIKYKVNSVSHIDLTKKEDLIEFGEKNIVGIIFPLERLIFSREGKRGREVIDLGVPVSISTDFNPGTSPSLNFPLIISLSIIREGLTVEEAINASTINSAYALGLDKEIGSIEVGKRANFLIFSLDSYKKIPYFVGMNFIKYVIINGEVKRVV